MTTINKFENAKIYRLIDVTTGMFYYGHTCLLRLDQRYYQHKINSLFSKTKKNYKVYKHFTKEKFEAGDIKIEEVERPQVSSKRELEKIENDYILQHINDELCINTIRSFISEEERHEWRQEIANKYAHKKLDEKFTCDCGSIISTFSKTRHIQSKKHQLWLTISKDE